MPGKRRDGQFELAGAGEHGMSAKKACGASGVVGGGCHAFPNRPESSSRIAISGGRIHPSATYRPWNMSGSAHIGSIPNVLKTVPVQPSEMDA